MKLATLSTWAAINLVFCLQTQDAAAAVWNVNPAGTGDAPTIQAAYDLASPGDLIILAPGTYIDSHTRTIQGHSSPRTTTATAFMSPGVDITSSGGADVTFIDGQDTRHGLFGVDVGGVNVSEITFVHCARAGGEIWGGGMMFHRSSPVVEHCRFVDNDAWAAGGVFVSQGSGAVIRFNTFIRNSGGDLAGAVEFFQHAGAFIQNNTFVSNSVGHESGGGNKAGGALVLNTTSSTIENNIFAFNDAVSNAGAIACINSHTETGSCNLFWSNQAPVDPNVSACAVVIGLNQNLLADPIFCNAALDDYTLASNSPAAPGASSCGLRGAEGVACGPVAVNPTSWGSVKANYR